MAATPDVEAGKPVPERGVSQTGRAAVFGWVE
jgi:hypothetical protein